jgi:hypothetical protein
MDDPVFSLNIDVMASKIPEQAGNQRIGHFDYCAASKLRVRKPLVLVINEISEHVP